MASQREVLLRIRWFAVGFLAGIATPFLAIPALRALLMLGIFGGDG